MFSEIKFSSEPQPFAFSSHRNPLFFFLLLTHICLNWDLANYTPYSTYEKRSASACFPSRALLLPCPSLGPSFDLAAETLKFGINAAIPSGPSGRSQAPPTAAGGKSGARPLGAIAGMVRFHAGVGRLQNDTG